MPAMCTAWRTAHSDWEDEKALGSFLLRDETDRITEVSQRERYIYNRERLWGQISGEDVEY